MENEQKGLRFAVIKPIEAVVNREGIKVEIAATGSDHEIVDKAIEDLARATGAKVTEISPGSRKSFGFSKWNALWNPEGPKAIRNGETNFSTS